MILFSFILVHGTLRSKRSMPIYGVDRALTFTAFKCYYKDCIPPPDPDTIPPATQRPAVFDYWNDATLWNMSSDGYLVNVGGSSGVPQDYDDVRIEFGKLICSLLRQIRLKPVCSATEASKSLLILELATISEPRHDKTNKMAVRPAKTQINLGIRPV